MPAPRVGPTVAAAVVIALALIATAVACAPQVTVNDDGEVRLTNDAFASRLTYNFARSVAVDADGGVHVVWYEEDLLSAHVRYARSLDGGRTWQHAGRISEGATGGQHPSIAASGTLVYVVWHTREERPRVMFRRSLDRGATWDVARPLAAPAAGAAHAVLAADGMRVHAVWGDNREATGEIYWATSADGGTTWEREMRLSEPGSFSWVPTIAVEGRLVLAAWVDYRDGNEEEYVRRSADDGATWSEPLRLTHDAADSWAPSIAVVDGVAHIAWFDRRHAPFDDVAVEHRADELLALVGAPSEAAPARDPAVYYLNDFTARLQRKVQEASRRAPDWVRQGGDSARFEAAFRRFETAANEWARGWEIYYRRSSDGGVTWAPEVRLTNAPDESARPSITVRGREIRVVWFDRRDGDYEIYAKRSSDAGATWGDDERITRSTGASMHPSVALGADGTAHVVWHDERHGNAEIYYRALR